MTVENGVRVVAGVIVLTGLAVGRWVSGYGYLLTAFAGVNLVQSAFTGFCPAAALLAKWGFKPSG